MRVEEEKTLEKVRAEFARAERPEEFIRGTCRCEECMEHNETMAAHTPETIGLEELGNAGWDPICMANDEAFAYYMPAMVRLAFGGEGYLEQLLFHLNMPGRVDALDGGQAKAVQEALVALVQAKAGQMEELDQYWMDDAMRRLQMRVGEG